MAAKTVWVNPDWSKARVYLATENMRCFGLDCPSQLIQPGDFYTKNRVKASGVYADRAFCIECHPVREMPAGFECYKYWRETMAQYDREWLRENTSRIKVGTMDKFEEKTLEADNLKLGERVAQVFYDGQGVPTYKIARVENVSPDLRIITAGLIRYGRDGWKYSKTDRLSSRIIQLTPEIDLYIRKKALVDYLSSIYWANEEMLTLEAVFNSYQSLRGRIG